MLYMVKLLVYSLKLPVLNRDVICMYSVTEVELTRAKNSTISSVLMNLESRVILEPHRNLFPFLVSCHIYLIRFDIPLLTLHCR